jgi:hypothetical protein
LARPRSAARARHRREPGTMISLPLRRLRLASLVLLAQASTGLRGRAHGGDRLSRRGRRPPRGDRRLRRGLQRPAVPARARRGPGGLGPGGAPSAGACRACGRGAHRPLPPPAPRRVRDRLCLPNGGRRGQPVLAPPRGESVGLATEASESSSGAP